MPSSACDWSSDVCSSDRSEEHTSELQSRSDLVCRLLLEKKKKKKKTEDHKYEIHSTTTDARRVMVGINTRTQIPTRTTQLTVDKQSQCTPEWQCSVLIIETIA